MEVIIIKNKQLPSQNVCTDCLPVGEAYTVFLLKHKLLDTTNPQGLKHEVYKHLFTNPFFNFLYQDSPEGLELVNALIADINAMDLIKIQLLAKQ